MTGGIDKKKLSQKEVVNISTITTFNPNLTTQNETFEADICIFAVNSPQDLLFGFLAISGKVSYNKTFCLITDRIFQSDSFWPASL